LLSIERPFEANGFIDGEPLQAGELKMGADPFHSPKSQDDLLPDFLRPDFFHVPQGGEFPLQIFSRNLQAAAYFFRVGLPGFFQNRYSPFLTQGTGTISPVIKFKADFTRPIL
jgi:hypothetical protein